MNILICQPQAMVIHGTWQEVLAELGPECVDVTLTDPPYTEHVQANIRSCTTNGNLKVREWKPDFPPLDGYTHVPNMLWASKRWALFFCALEQFGEYKFAAGGQRSSKHAEDRLKCYIRSWVWRKQQAAPQLSGDRPANSCEGIAVCHRPGRMHWNGHGQHAWTNLSKGEELNPEQYLDNCCEFGRERKEKRHPCQKPEELIKHLVEKFTDPGELIGDWYAGSGVLAKAALPLGRRVLLVESDPFWAQECANVCQALLRIA